MGGIARTTREPTERAVPGPCRQRGVDVSGRMEERDAPLEIEVLLGRREFCPALAGREPQLALWEAEDLIDPLDAEPPSAQQAALRAAFAASPFGHLEPIAVEHPVAVRVGGHLIRGRIDAVFAIDGEHWLVDWKTTASGGADPLQLAVYRAAWSAQQGIPPELVVGCFVFVQQRRYEIYRGLPGVEDLPRAGSDATVTMAPTEVAEWEA